MLALSSLWSFGWVALRVLFGQELAQAVEVALPAGAVRADPLLNVLERFALDPTSAHAANLLRVHEPAIFQHSQVLHDRRERHLEGSGELAHRGRTAAQT